MMKKLTAIMMALLMVVTVTGCGKEESPSDVTTAYMTNMQKEMADSISKLEAGEGDILSDVNLDPQMIKNISEQSKKELETFVKKMSEFEYVIKNEEIKDDKAVVTVEITTYAFGDKLTNSLSNIMTNAMSWSMMGMSEEEITSKLMEQLFADINKAEKTYKKEVDIELTKGDKGWAVSTDMEKNQAFLNVMTGGLIDLLSSLDMGL